jgi:hypothetical protein
MGATAAGSASSVRPPLRSEQDIRANAPIVPVAHCIWRTEQHKKCARESDLCVLAVTRMPGYVEGRLTGEQRAAYDKCRADYEVCNNQC